MHSENASSHRALHRSRSRFPPRLVFKRAHNATASTKYLAARKEGGHLSHKTGHTIDRKASWEGHSAASEYSYTHLSSEA